MQITPETYDFNAEFQTEQFANKINFEEKRIIGEIDDLEAVKQAVYKILHTERFNSLVYTWDYGVEFENLIGKDYDFILGDLQRRIEEALLQDDRIERIENVKVDKKQNDSIDVSFIVISKYGNVTMGVNINV